MSFPLFLRGGKAVAASDTTPNAFSFTDLASQTESTTITGSAVTITGIDASTSFTVTGGTVQINGAGSFVSSGSVVNNDTLTPRGTANAAYLGTTDVVVTVGGVSDTFTITTRADPSGSPALVGPHASWTGTAGTGATAPTDPTRTTAKPMASWWSPTLQRFTDDMIVGVIADAKGGIASVLFSGDCASTTVATPTIRTYTDANGVSKQTPLGYWINLDQSAFVAVNGTTGKINLYATVTATDGTMQARVIGGTNVDGSDNLISLAQPQQHYPRTTQYDWVKTIGSGGDYSTWDSCMAALLTAAPKAPHVTFITTGTYSSAGIDFGNQHTGIEGYCVVDAAPGVTATITRGTSFVATGGSSTPNYWTRPWYFFPGCDQIKFTGAGVVLDIKNFKFLMQMTNYRPFWFDGCKIINSIATLDTQYFNGGPHPGFSTMKKESNSVPSYVNDIYAEYIDLFGGFTWNNNQAHYPRYGNHDGIRLNTGNYERGATPEFDFLGTNKMSATYSGAATTARCKVYGYDSGNKVELYENGSLVKTVTFPNLKENRSYQTAAQAGTTVNPEVSAVVTELNTRSGWTFTELNVGKTWFAWAFQNGSSSDQNCKSVTATFTCGIDAHTEFLHHYVGGATDENFIIWNNTVRDAYYTSCYFNSDTSQDVSLKFNVFDVTPGGLDSAGNSQWGLGKHLLIENNFLHDGIREEHATGKDAYSSVRLNITTGGANKNSAGVWPSAPGYQDNLWVPSGDGQPAGSLDSGNITAANAAAIYALFTDRTNGDYRPASGGALTTNLKAKRRDYDGRDNALAATDAIGPWAIGYSAPSYPF